MNVRDHNLIKQFTRKLGNGSICSIIQHQNFQRIYLHFDIDPTAR